MPEIPYADFKTHLNRIASTDGASLPPVILIHGEELLYKTALQAILNTVLPLETQAVGYEPVDGAPENVYIAIEKLTTYSFFSERKVVGFLDTRIFHGKTNADELFQKIRAAVDENDIRTAAKIFFSLLSVVNLTIEDVRDKNYAVLKLDVDPEQDSAWLDSLVAYCLENPIGASSGEDSAKTLQRAIEKGFVPNAFLILTTDMVDKRKGLYKAVLEKGLIIDCSAPTTDSWADRKIKAAILEGQLRSVLTPIGKVMDKEAFRQLVEATGFDLRTFSGNLQKLAQYAGERSVITAEDVQAVIPRTRQEPIYEMTGAVLERKSELALLCLRALLSRGFFPLQIVAAITKQIRKLLILKDIMEAPAFRFWKPGYPYEQFNRQFAQMVLPALQAQDAALIERLDTWSRIDAPETTADKAPAPAGKRKKKPSQPPTELLVSRQANPFAVYKLMQSADRFSKQELIQAVSHLYHANIRLVSGTANPALILENMILSICDTLVKSQNPDGSVKRPQARRTNPEE